LHINILFFLAIFPPSKRNWQLFFKLIEPDRESVDREALTIIQLCVTFRQQEHVIKAILDRLNFYRSLSIETINFLPIDSSNDEAYRKLMGHVKRIGRIMNGQE
jgi:hypothetical protein